MGACKFINWHDACDFCPVFTISQRLFRMEQIVLVSFHVLQGSLYNVLSGTQPELACKRLRSKPVVSYGKRIILLCCWMRIYRHWSHKLMPRKKVIVKSTKQGSAIYVHSWLTQPYRKRLPTGRWDQIWVSERSELIQSQARHAETKRRLRVLLRILLKINTGLTGQHLKYGVAPAVSFIWLRLLVASSYRDARSC